MGTAAEARQYFESLKSQITTIAGAAMMEHKDEIVPLLIHQHTIEFVDSAGNPLRTEIKKYVFDFSPNKSPFRLIGSSVGSENIGDIFLKIDEDIYEFGSPATTKEGTLKTDCLTQWNGSEIMDLTPENEKLIFPIIAETFTEKINEGID